MIKVYWLGAGASRVVSGVLVVSFPCCPANEKQGPAPEEMSVKILTNNFKTQGKNEKVHAVHIIKPTCSGFALIRGNMVISMENRRIPLKI